MKHLSVCILLLLIPALSAYGQQIQYGTMHRPDGQQWQELNTPRFRVIYPAGYDSVAYLSARMLEEQYPLTYALTGGSLKKFPVVITDYNDRSNGFVTSLNFRSEFDLAPNKGKTMNPGSGSLLETVLPHELLHANHANVNRPRSIGALIRLISPDMARSINFFPPLGVHEGLAVYHESVNGVDDRAGRGNHGYFMSQFHANALGNEPWSMGQTLMPSAYTLPYDRHYIAGFSFTEWLHQKYGNEVSQKAINTHYNWFFLGYGFALKRATGKWPGELYGDYLSEMRERAVVETESRRTTEEVLNTVKSPYSGARVRGPVWVSDHEIVFFSAQYNEQRGLYNLDLNTGNQDKLKEDALVGDYRLSYNPDTDQLYYSVFSANRVFLTSYLSDLKVIQVQSGDAQTLTKRARIFAPEIASDGSVYALQANKLFAQMIRIQDNRIDTLQQFDTAHPVQVETNPTDSDELAVILNRRGVQGIWLAELSSLDEDLSGLPDVALPNTSIFDAQWHPDGSKIMFTGIAEDDMEIFEYDIRSGQIYQLTETEFGAFEASYAPDGNRIAFVTQENPEQQLATLQRKDFLNKPVKASDLYSREVLMSELTRPFLGETMRGMEQEWETSEYRMDWSWLSPRLIMPVSINRSSEVYELGAYISSADVLGSQSYQLQLTGLENRLWYNFNYTHRTFWPGFSTSFYSEPSYVQQNFEAAEDRITMLRQERGFRLSVPMTYQFRDLSRSSSAAFTPYFEVDGARYFDLENNALSGFISQQSLGASTQFNWRMLYLPRDVQASSGIQLLATAETTLDAPRRILTMPSGNRYWLNLQNRYAFYYGANAYVSPLRRWNQSLQLSVRMLNQSAAQIFSTNTITPLGYGDNPFFGSTDVGRFSARYVIPFWYPDDGGMLLPFYLSTMYFSLFSHTMADFTDSSWQQNTRTIIGAGLHLRFRISNLSFDAAVGLAYEPSRNNTEFIIGEF